MVTGHVKQPKLELCISQKELQHKQVECQAYSVHMDYLAVKQQVTAVQMAEKQREEKKRLLATATREHADAIKEIERKLNAARQKEIERKQHKLTELKQEMEKANEYKKEQIKRQLEDDRKIAMEQEEINKRRDEQEAKLRAQIEEYFHKVIKLAERRELLARWKMVRCQLHESRKKFLLNYEWTAEPSEDVSSKLETVKEVKFSSMKIEVQSVFDEGKKHSGINENIGLEVIDGDQAGYADPSPTDESTSGYEMTLSKMSTSSDFVDTPHDEAIPDLEIDPEKSNAQIPDGKIVNSVKVKLFDNEGKHDDPKLYAKLNQQRVLREEYDLENGSNRDIDYGDANANFVSGEAEQVDDIIADVDDEENGNVERDIQLFDDINSNLRQSSTSDVQYKEPLTVGTRFTVDVEDDSNGNLCIPSYTDVLQSYRERRAEAAAIKKKVLSQEYLGAFSSKNSDNVRLSKPVHSSEALANKKKVLDVECGPSNLDERKFEDATDTISYSRQTSGSSVSSIRSCLSYDRQTSASTVFYTPDEERPVLIDQVGGEVLKERGRSIHGHASDAVIQKLLWKHEPVSPVSLDLSEMPSTEEQFAPAPCTVKPDAYTQYDFILRAEKVPALDGRPSSTVENIRKSIETLPCISSGDLACFPVNFIRSIRTHLAIQ
ncbi:hypothetical protein SK128_028357 [Halocaridina rubra]|uniref:Uncharacterized protein n=1 Tax=Halocaridina rubra TaxID=373956 RepID=A0AAN9AFE8_HALRR